MSSSETSDVTKRLIDAVRYGRLKEVIKLARKFSYDVKVLSETLIRSCRKGRLNIVKWLTKNTAADVNYNKSDVLRDTSLTAASRNNHLVIVKYLMETCNADVNLADSVGNTSLSMACRKVSLSVSMYLLSEVSDLDVNIADKYGNTSLHYAVWYSKDDYTQLHLACGYRYGYRGDVTEVLRLIYASGHKFNVQDNNGDTPLHYACSNGYSDIVETLMLAGADETITNDRGETPAKVAERMGHNELQNLLDRDRLFQVMLGRRKKLKLSLILMIMLTIRLMMQRQGAETFIH